MADGEIRRTLTQERVVAEALTLIAQEGAEALTMRDPIHASRGGSRCAIPARA